MITGPAGKAVSAGPVFFTADGEGYEVKVYCEEQEAYWDKAKLPYSGDDTFINADDDISPWELFSKYEHK